MTRWYVKMSITLIILAFAFVAPWAFYGSGVRTIHLAMLVSVSLGGGSATTGVFASTHAKLARQWTELGLKYRIVWERPMLERAKVLSDLATQQIEIEMREPAGYNPTLLQQCADEESDSWGLGADDETPH